MSKEKMSISEKTYTSLKNVGSKPTFLEFFEGFLFKNTQNHHEKQLHKVINNDSQQQKITIVSDIDFSKLDPIDQKILEKVINITKKDSIAVMKDNIYRVGTKKGLGGKRVILIKIDENKFKIIKILSHTDYEKERKKLNNQY